MAHRNRWFTELKNGDVDPWPMAMLVITRGYMNWTLWFHHVQAPKKNRKLRIPEVDFYPLVIFHGSLWKPWPRVRLPAGVR